MDSVTPVRIQEAEEKATSQVLRDIEASICSDNGAVTGSGTVAGKLRGLGVWLDPTLEAVPFQLDHNPLMTPFN